MHLKIWKKSQLGLLKTVNPLLGQKKIPWEVIQRAEEILKLKDLGRDGFIAIMK